MGRWVDTSGVGVGATTRRLPPARRVCWLGPEPQGTPNHTFSPPNGSPSHHFRLKNRDLAQNSGLDLAVGVPGPESQLFLFILDPKSSKADFLAVFRIYPRPIAMDLGPQGPTGRQFRGRPRCPGAHGALVHGPPNGPSGPRGPGTGPGTGPWSQGSQGAQGDPRGPRDGRSEVAQGAQGPKGPTVRPSRGRPRGPGAHGAPVQRPPKGPRGPRGPWGPPRGPGPPARGVPVMAVYTGCL